MIPRLTAILALTAATVVSAAPTQEQVEARLKKDVTFLASPACEGRGPATAGLKKAGDYLAGQFKTIGLKPAFKDGYFQTFDMAATKGEIALTGPNGQAVELKQGKDFNPFGIRQQGGGRGGVVFAGYGWQDGSYDDYAGIEVKGKVVVMFTGLPRVEPSPRVPTRIGQRLQMAEKKGAIAVLLVNDRASAGVDDRLVDFRFGDVLRGGKHLPAVLVKRSVIESMLPGNKTLSDIEKSINRDYKPDSFALAGWRAVVDVKRDDKAVGLRNVVGVLDGEGPLANETLVIGAHYDHLGWGGPSSAESPVKAAIHHGADDNASGTAALLELARHFASIKKREGRRLVFCAFSGEEQGLFGSKEYCKNSPYPLDKTAAMFNLDMVGRLRPDKKTGKPRLLTEGHGTAKPFKELIDKLATKHGFTLSSKSGGFGPSDHASFTAKKIPVLFYWTDAHENYHRPTDTAERINYTGMVQVIDIGKETVTALASMEKPAFVVVKDDPGPRPSDGPRLGIRPGYQEETPGVVVEGVSPGGPADKGGVLDGDVIVGLAGKPVKDLKTYMVIMATQKPKTTIDVEVLRKGKKMMLKVPLE